MRVTVCGHTPSRALPAARRSFPCVRPGRVHISAAREGAGHPFHPLNPFT